jgi:uncharacterized protein (TIGR02145 family)
MGYNGFNYSSTTRPTKPGFYRANNVSGSNAGSPFEYDIFRCTTCGTVPEYVTRPQGTLTGNTSGTGQLTYTSSNGGGPFTIVYQATGASPVTVNNISSTVAFNVVTPTITTSYKLISVTDEISKATTDFSGTIATVSVIPPSAILSGSTGICSGSTANLILRTTGTGSITVTLNNGTVINTVSGTITMSVTPTTNTAYSIASVTDSYGNSGASTSIAIISIYAPASITVQPLSPLTINEGTTATLSVTATGQPTLNYQWYKDGVAISGANNSSYTTTNTISAAGTYYVTVSTTCNVVSSTTSTVSVSPRPQGSLTGSTINQGGTGQLTYTSSNGGGPFTIVYQPAGGSNVTVTNVTSGVAFNVASGTPTGTTNYSLVSVTDQTSTASRTSGFTGATSTITTVLSSVTIGTQNWTDKNLDVTTYRDGTVIPQVTDDSEWASLTTGAWCYYQNLSSNGTTYGKLYNWYAVAGIFDEASKTDTSIRKKIAPAGWHVPSDEEWTDLIIYLGGESVAGGKMKSTGTTYWGNPNTGTNSSGFSALPGGMRDVGGNFWGGAGDGWLFSTIWSSTSINATTSRNFFFSSSGDNIESYSGNIKRGKAVRLVKD